MGIDAVSASLETEVNNKINKFGGTVSIISQLGTADVYDEISSWSHLATTTTKAVVLPFRGITRRTLTIPNEEWIYDKHGVIQKNKYIAWFKASETIEETQAISGGITVATTRYLIYFNDQKYDIVQLKPYELQDNVFMKIVYMRLLTE